MYENIFNDMKDIPEQVPVVPQGTYNAQVASYAFDTVQTKDGVDREVIRLQLLLQGNGNIFMSDGQTPVDGAALEYTLWLPTEADKAMPSKFGKGTMYEVTLRKLKKFFSAAGVPLEQFKDLKEALDAAVGANVIVVVENAQGEDGSLYERVTRIK